jgi:hypothetical protein
MAFSEIFFNQITIKNYNDEKLNRNHDRNYIIADDT